MVDTTKVAADRTPKGYYPYPYSQSPLSDSLHRGLYAPGMLGLASTIASLSLLVFIVYRFSTWQRHYKSFVGYNQYVLLIMNLLIADLIQAVSFLVSFHWIREDAMLAPSPACFGQGLLLNVGDLTSGFFVMAIALHTFYTAVKGRRISYRVFLTSIISIWGLGVLLSVVGPIEHGNHYFVKAGAWCWASPQYENDRLALHYIWIFIVQFGTIIVYIAVLLHLKAAMRAIVPSVHSQSNTLAKVDRASKLMVLYPFFYIVLTLPLSAGRMWSMAHSTEELPDAYQCVAGAMLASSGLVDALLYTLTRKTLLVGGSSKPIANNRHGAGLKDSTDKSGNPSVSLAELGIGGITQTRTVVVTDQMINLPSDDEDEDRGRKPSKTDQYHNFDRISHSPTGSLDPIIGANRDTPDRDAEKTVKFATNIRVTALDDPSDDDRSPGLEHSTSSGGNGRKEFRRYSRGA